MSKYLVFTPTSLTLAHIQSSPRYPIHDQHGYIILYVPRVRIEPPLDGSQTTETPSVLRISVSSDRISPSLLQGFLCLILNISLS